MGYSLNEIAATTRKAVRAVGYPWGTAEETAANVYWMYSCRLEACAPLLRVLHQLDGTDLKTYTPVCQGTSWQSTNQVLCPLITSSALTDRVHALSEASTLTIQQVLEPQLLINAVFYLANFTGQVSMRWADSLIVTDGEVMATTGLNLAVAPDSSSSIAQNAMSSADKIEIADVEIRIRAAHDSAKNAFRSVPDAEIAMENLVTRATPSASNVKALEQLAQRTYAPATEESRRKGAGSDLSDND